MVEIIPAIIAKDFGELKEKIDLVKACVKTVQIDVMDGIFVNNKTWPYFASQGGASSGKSFSSELNNLDTNIFLEVHLMIENPHQVLNEWLNANVGRIVLHWEALEKIHNHELLPYETQVDSRFPVSNLSREIHRCGKQFGVALNPKTPIEVLDNFINDIDSVLLMSVEPGFAGQEFKEEVIPKIITLRQRHENVKIEVDGGVSPQNILKLAEAGVDFLVIGSAVFSAQEPCSVFASMSKILKGRKR